MAGDPISGSGGRIVERARLPCTATLFYPIAILMFGYFSNSIANGQDYLGTLKQLKDSAAIWLSPLAIIPTSAFAFFREIGLHAYLDKLLGVRNEIGQLIARQMSELAKESGYDHPDRIIQNHGKAMNWFYSYANQQNVLRAYAFEVWEAYYVGLYISLAAILAFLMCIYLFVISKEGWVLASSLVPLLLLIVVWGVRRFSIVPRMKRLVIQQTGEMPRDGQVLAEARNRFG